jgi:hypothetical protein
MGQVCASNAADPTQTQTSAGRTALPSGTLTVSPTIVSVSIAPGGSGSADLTVRSGVVQTVSVQVAGLGQLGDGSFSYLSAAADTSAYSARSMVTVSPTTFQMNVGTEQTISLKVAVPQNAGNGTRYAALRISGTPGTGNQNVGIGVEIGIPILVSLADTQATTTGAVAGLSVASNNLGRYTVTGSVTNTGNSHYGAPPNQVNVNATVYDATNKVFAGGKEVFTGNSIVPSFSRDFSLDLGKPLTAGHYRLEVSAVLQNGTVLGKTALAFDVSGDSVAGATSVAVMGGNQNNGSGSGPDNGTLLIAVCGGVLAGALVAALVIVGTRRRGKSATA